MGGLQQSVADERHEYCYACYTGDYPTDFVNIEQLVRAGKKAGQLIYLRIYVRPRVAWNEFFLKPGGGLCR